jgi:KDO2-lipid IV(A) lauroyltransferase
VKEKIIITAIKAVLTLLSWLPLGLARALGATIGQCAWLFKTRSARTAIANLNACFPELNQKSRNALAAKSMRHWGRTVCEIPVVWRRGTKSLGWVKEVQGRERLEQAIANGKGVIIVSPHLGNWEIIGYWAGTVGSLTTLYQPPRRYDLDELIRHVRSKTGATLVPTNARGVASLLKTLKRGDIVGVLPDMEPDWSSGVFAPFFGVQALTMTLIHNLVQRSGAAVFLGFAQRIGGGFKIVLVEPDSAINSDNPEISVAELNKAVETLVLRSLEQYQWEYKRFKRRPVGMPKIYH